MHQPTNGKLAFLFYFFVREIWPIQRSGKIQKRPQLVWKRRGGEEGELSVCLHMRFKYEVKLSDRNCKIERGIAVMLLALITTCLMYRNRLVAIVLMVDESGSATDIDCLLVSSGLSAPIFTLIGNDDFWSSHTDFRQQMSPKNGNLEFSEIFRRDRVGFSNCLDLHMHYCATVSPSNFQVHISSGWDRY